MSGKAVPLIDIKDYKPGRFAYLMDRPFVRELWAFIADDSRMQSMFAAAAAGRPAIEPLLADIESRFEEHLGSAEYPDGEIAVLVNNMIRQVMEKSGYEFIACGMCRSGRYIKSSGLFSRIAPQ
jgi:hypothetical protein